MSQIEKAANEFHRIRSDFKEELWGYGFDGDQIEDVLYLVFRGWDLDFALGYAESKYEDEDGISDDTQVLTCEPQEASLEPETEEIRKAADAFLRACTNFETVLHEHGLDENQSDRVLSSMVKGGKVGYAVYLALHESGQTILSEGTAPGILWVVWSMPGGKQIATWLVTSGEEKWTRVMGGKFATRDEKGEWVVIHKPWEVDMV